MTAEEIEKLSEEDCKKIFVWVLRKLIKDTEAKSMEFKGLFRWPMDNKWESLKIEDNMVLAVRLSCKGTAELILYFSHYRPDGTQSFVYVKKRDMNSYKSILLKLSEYSYVTLYPEYNLNSWQFSYNINTSMGIHQMLLNAELEE